MPQLPTTILLHTGDPEQPEHYDWLLAFPPEHTFSPLLPTPYSPTTAAAATIPRLLTFQTHVHPIDWPNLQTSLLLRRIFDHREKYLDYAGPISRNRGHVTPVAAGHHTPETFTPELITTCLQLKLLHTPSPDITIQAAIIPTATPYHFSATFTPC